MTTSPIPMATTGLGALTFAPDTGVATLRMQMEGRANKVNATFIDGLEASLDALEGYAGLKGVVVSSGHNDWCVGADLEVVFSSRDAAQVAEGCTRLNAAFRRLETLGVPVVAALTGSALGGGYELALACHHRVALGSPRLKFGLPEVTLGVIPGAGGTQRLPRLIGLQPALETMLEGRMLRAPKAAKVGLVDALADTPEAVVEAAHAWIAANPKAQQPWDAKRFRWPGVRPLSAEGMQLFMAGAALLYKKTAGAYEAPKLCLAAVQEGAKLALDQALQVETRYFAKLASGDQAKAMIRTVWFHRRAAERFEGLDVAESPGVDKVAVLGAGMMGAGLAWILAKSGHEVVLKDVTDAALAKARAHLDKQAARIAKHKGADAAQAVLDRIAPTLELDALRGADLVIEAVFEDAALKARVTKEVEPLLADGAIFASNTSALPIGLLAKASARPENFVGLHFFSPVETMQLVEIIPGPETSPETLSRGLAVAKALGKLPIVVGDSYGFYTSRTFGSYLTEAVQLVAEGHSPALVEWAARTAGMVVSPLKVYDEVTLGLGLKAQKARAAFDLPPAPAEGAELLRAMVEDHGRPGKAAGKGFYDYDGKRRRLWPGLSDLVKADAQAPDEAAVQERLMYAQVAQVGWCLNDGILTSPRDADVGAVFGIGFAPGSGGPCAWMDQRGLKRVVADLERLAAAHGPRFTPAPKLIEMAAQNASFYPT